MDGKSVFVIKHDIEGYYVKSRQDGDYWWPSAYATLFYTQEEAKCFMAKMGLTEECSVKQWIITEVDVAGH